MNYKLAITENLKIRNGRKLVLWSCGVLKKYLLENFGEMKIAVDFIIEEGIDEVEGGPQENFVFVALYSGHKEVFEKLRKKGYKYNQDFILTNLSMYVKDLNLVDPLLTYSREEKKYPGFVQFGRSEEKECYRVLVLGNSTSEPSIGGMNCWANYLQKELKKELGKDTIIYNGAISGYNSAQEFLKLARDGVKLHPNMVISFSGVNDVDGFGSTVNGFNFLHKYQKRMWDNILNIEGTIPDSIYMRDMNKITYGIESGKKDYVHWINNERKMYAICKEFDIDFIGCLQPMITQGEYIVGKEMQELLEDAGVDIRYETAQRMFVEGVKKIKKKYKWLIDLTELFRNRTDLYNDHYHYNEVGNKLIAKKVAELIGKKVRQ